MLVNDNVKVYKKIIQKYTISTECCKGYELPLIL